MGFFSRLKAERQSVQAAQEIMSQPGFAEMMRSGQEAAAQMRQPGRMEEMMAYAQRAQVIAASGVQTPATIRSVERPEPAAEIAPGGAPQGFGPAGPAPTYAVGGLGDEVTINVEVQPAGKPAYEASFKQTVSDQILPMLTPGSRITVRVDPNDPNSMLYWGGPSG